MSQSNGRVTVAALLLRLALGSVFFAHGAQKLLGWFGGYGLSSTIHGFTQGMGVPLPLAYAAVMVEFFGSILLVLGLLVRPVAFVMAVHITVATFVGHHLGNGFFMNWSSQPGRGEGFEFNLCLLLMFLALLALGGGGVALDGALRRKAH
ncbi:MAG TPA: DoxX family protein [Candidatus Saccharimonadales bacterium]|nr:DoxX family protein [Candidatus Saccharimonadales bacterium]